MSRRAMSRLLPLWSSRVFSVELNGEPVYFSIQEKSRGKEVPRVFRNVQNDDRCYSLLVCSSDRIKRAKFYAELKQKLLRDMPKECELSPMSSFLPNVKDSLLKGYFLKDKSPSASLSERVLLELIQHDPVLVCSYLRSEDGQQWTQRLWKDAENQTMDMSKDFCIVPSEAPDVHPATLNIINSDVFYNFEEAYGVLKELSGKWYLIAMSSDACWFRAFVSAFFLPSASINIMLKDMTGIYDFTTNIQGYGYCINSLNQVAYRNGKIVSVQSGPKSEMEGYTLLPLSGCPDCIIFSRRGPTNTLMLHSLRKNIDAAQLEEFGRQAILLGSSNLHFINNNHGESADIIPEATSVLELLPCRAEARSKPDFPVIVIEGLDATGKTTLTESLKNTLGATLLRSPPQCLSPLRACFDREPPLIRRAFYALGNYITAETMGQEGMKTPVIVDRFWHSTAAYAIATAVSGPVCNLPAEGSEVYRWPTDLLQPSLVVLLTLDPEERKRRLRDRGQGETAEEQELDHNQLFRLKVEEAYRRISGPACVTVDASPPADQVLQQVLLLIRGKCHL